VILSLVALASAQPQLVVQITVDQLRADHIEHHAEQFGDQGFGRFLTDGTWFTRATHAHAITETGPGHAALATGTWPSVNGIVGNRWVVDGEETASVGTPPAAELLLTSTFSDELVRAGLGRSYGISFKDRGAVFTAGHEGRAWWAQGDHFAASEAYPKDPKWVTKFNASGAWTAWMGQSWDVTAPWDLPADVRAGERPHKSMGDSFPHVLPSGDDYFSALRYTPMADELLADFAIELMTREKVGRRGTDYVAISFSATDYIGHQWGPGSREYVDNLYRLNNTIERLLSWIDERIGLENALIVLSADHGSGEQPEQWVPVGAMSERFSEVEIIHTVYDQMAPSITEKPTYLPPYMDVKVAEGKDPAEVRRRTARALMREPHVFMAVARDDLADPAWPQTPFEKRVARSYHPDRSGDIYVVFHPGNMVIQSRYGDQYSARHGSPWLQDLSVPLMWLGSGIVVDRVDRPVSVAQIAPTLSEILGISKPSGSTENPLGEVLER